AAAGGAAWAWPRRAAPDPPRPDARAPSDEKARRARALLASAQAKVTRRDWSGAESDAAAALAPEPAEAWTARAMARSGLGAFEAAADDATHALRLAPGDLVALDARAVARA